RALAVNAECHQEGQPILAASLIAQQFMPADVRTSRPSLSTKLKPPLTLANLVTSDHGAPIETQRTVQVSGGAEPAADGTASTAAAMSTRLFIVHLLEPQRERWRIGRVDAQPIRKHLRGGH